MESGKPSSTPSRIARPPRPAVITIDPRSRLDAERREAGGAVRAAGARLDELMLAHRDVAADDEHDPEGPTVSVQRAELSAYLRQSRQHVENVDAAFRRLEEGGYGVCENCGRDIPAARLDARPFAVRCVACAALAERR